MSGNCATRRGHADVRAGGDTWTVLYRRFGRTELQMPVFSCGGMRFQQSWSDRGQPIRDEAQENLAATVQAAMDRGITHIETARGYGTS